MDAGEQIDSAVAAVEGLAGRPLPEHVAAFERVLAALQDQLAQAED
ncbi:MAG TPA: hypothetical protein VK046_14710 [Actinomycetaceae bacterium]|nr:hypothetical protein [Actinomycetaceae bacterium]